LTQQLTEQQKEDEDEKDRGTKAMQTKDITHILPAIDKVAEKLRYVDHNWECSSFEFVQEKKKNQNR